MQATETHPPARTLVMVRTGASVVEIRVPAVAREPSQSNLSDGFSRSQHSKHSRSVNDLPIRVPNLDLSQIQLLHLFFDLRAVSHRTNDHLVWLNVFLRYCLRLFDGPCVDVIRLNRL